MKNKIMKSGLFKAALTFCFSLICLLAGIGGAIKSLSASASTQTVDEDVAVIAAADDIEEVVELDQLNYFNIDNKGVLVGLSESGSALIEENKYFAIKLPSFANNIVSIGDSAFMDNSYLVSVEIPYETELIDRYAFRNCVNLTSVKWHQLTTVSKKIGLQAFSRCTNLTTVELCDAVNYIDTNAFEYCENLSNFTLPKFIETIAPYAFVGCTSLESVNIGNTCEQVYYSAFEGCTNLKSVYIGSGDIGPSAFADCTNLTDITFSPNITSISGTHIFENCSKLETVKLPWELKSIGGYTFYNCTSLKTVNTGGITVIDDRMFRGCVNLESVEIPCATRISTAAFYECEKLKFIECPDSLTSIGNESIDHDTIFIFSSKSIAKGVNSYDIRAKITYPVELIIRYYDTDKHTQVEIDGYQYKLYKQDIYWCYDQDDGWSYDENYTLPYDNDDMYWYDNSNNYVDFEMINDLLLNGKIDEGNKYGLYQAPRIDISIDPEYYLNFAEEVEYDNVAYKPEIYYNGNTLLIENVDYIIESISDDLIQIGVKTFTITGIKRYKGTYIGSFTIVACDISDKIIISWGYDERTSIYDGTSKVPTVSVNHRWVNRGSSTLGENDYTISYKNYVDGTPVENPTDAGKYYIIVKGINNFTGESTDTFTIDKRPLSLDVYSSNSSYVDSDRNYDIFYYENKEYFPTDIYSVARTIVPDFFELEIRMGSRNGTVVSKGKDVGVYNVGVYYVYAYSTNDNYVDGYSDCLGRFEIYAARWGYEIALELSDDMWTSGTPVVYNGQDRSVTVTLTYKTTGEVIASNLYTIIYTKNNQSVSECKDVGTYTLTITFVNSNFTTETRTRTLNIKEKSIDDLLELEWQEGSQYTGSHLSPEINLIDNDTFALNDIDYTVEYRKDSRYSDPIDSCVDNGNYYILVKGTNNFNGEVEISFTIKQRDISTLVDASKISFSYEYDGEKHEADLENVKIYLFESLLIKGTDYRIEYSTVNPESLPTWHKQSVDAGAFKAKFTGYGNFTNSFEITYYITPKSIDGMNFEVVNSPKEYTGSYFIPTYYPYLSETSECTITYYTDEKCMEPINLKDIINVGHYYMVIEGINNYTGSNKAEFEIIPLDISNYTVEFYFESNNQKIVPYNGEIQIPIFRIRPTYSTTFDNYSVIYQDENGNPVENPKNAGVYTVIVNLNSNYAGNFDNLTFEITPIDVANYNVVTDFFLNSNKFTTNGGGTRYTGDPILLTVDIWCNLTNFTSAHLVEDVDYKVIYYKYKNSTSIEDYSDDDIVLNPTNCGIYIMFVKGINNFTGTNYRYYSIQQLRPTVEITCVKDLFVGDVPTIADFAITSSNCDGYISEVRFYSIIQTSVIFGNNTVQVTFTSNDENYYSSSYDVSFDAYYKVEVSFEYSKDVSTIKTDLEISVTYNNGEEVIALDSNYYLIKYYKDGTLLSSKPTDNGNYSFVVELTEYAHDYKIVGENSFEFTILSTQASSNVDGIYAFNPEGFDETFDIEVEKITDTEEIKSYLNEVYDELSNISYICVVDVWQDAQHAIATICIPNEKHYDVYFYDGTDLIPLNHAIAQGYVMNVSFNNLPTQNDLCETTINGHGIIIFVEGENYIASNPNVPNQEPSNIGMIAGIAGGVVAILAVTVIVVVVTKKKKKSSK